MVVDTSELNVEGIVRVAGVPRFPVQHRDDEASVGAAEAIDGGHVLVADGEVEQLEVLLDARGRHRLGDDRDATLNLQADIDLAN